MSDRHNFTCDEETTELLKLLAKSKHKSVSAVIYELVLKSLEIEEDIYLSQLAEEAEKASEGKPTLSHEEVWLKFGLK